MMVNNLTSEDDHFTDGVELLQKIKREVDDMSDSLDIDNSNLTSEVQLQIIHENLSIVPALEKKLKSLELLSKELTSDADRQLILTHIEGVKTRLLTITSQAERRRQQIQVESLYHAIEA